MPKQQLARHMQAAADMAACSAGPQRLSMGSRVTLAHGAGPIQPDHRYVTPAMPHQPSGGQSATSASAGPSTPAMPDRHIRQHGASGTPAAASPRPARRRKTGSRGSSCAHPCRRGKVGPPGSSSSSTQQQLDMAT